MYVQRRNTIADMIRQCVCIKDNRDVSEIVLAFGLHTKITTILLHRKNKNKNKNTT